jgi:hypothetical protein
LRRWQRAYAASLRAGRTSTAPSSSREIATGEHRLRCQRRGDDSTYLALALVEDAIFVTADRRLYDVVVGSPLRDDIRWVADGPASGGAAT